MLIGNYQCTAVPGLFTIVIYTYYRLFNFPLKWVVISQYLIYSLFNFVTYFQIIFCIISAGEFVWRPGALTQAILNGHWILMEDIDKAPLDTVSQLLN